MAISFIQMTYNLVDILWIGRLGSKSVAAVGSVGMLMWMMNSVALISKVGAEISIGQSIGARQPALASVYASHTTTIALLLGLTFGIFFFLFPHPFVSFFNLEREISLEAVGYLQIIAIGIPVMFLILTFSGIYIGSGRSDIPFYFNAAGLLCNILLDPLLIFGIGPFPVMGVKGSALATLLSQGLVLLLFIFQLKRRNGLLGRFRFLIRPRRRYTVNILKLGLPVAAMNVYFAFINMNLARTASLYGGYLGITSQTTGGQAGSIDHVDGSGHVVDLDAGSSTIHLDGVGHASSGIEAGDINRRVISTDGQVGGGVDGQGLDGVGSCRRSTRQVHRAGCVRSTGRVDGHFSPVSFAISHVNAVGALGAVLEVQREGVGHDGRADIDGHRCVGHRGVTHDRHVSLAHVVELQAAGGTIGNQFGDANEGVGIDS